MSSQPSFGCIFYPFLIYLGLSLLIHLGMEGCVFAWIFLAAIPLLIIATILDERNKAREAERQARLDALRRRSGPDDHVTFTLTIRKLP